MHVVVSLMSKYNTSMSHCGRLRCCLTQYCSEIINLCGMQILDKKKHATPKHLWGKKKLTDEEVIAQQSKAMGPEFMLNEQ